MSFQLNPATGEWEWQGAPPDDDVTPAAPSATATSTEPQPKPQRTEQKRDARPWWEAIPGARYLTPGQGFFGNLQNDIKFEINQLTNTETALPRVQSYLIDAVTPGNQVVKDTNKLGMRKALTNAQKAGLDLVGQLTPEREGQIDEDLDNFYRANGFTPPSEMTDEELGGDDMRASLMLNLALGVGTMGAGNAVAGSALATKFPALARAANLFNPGAAKTTLGTAVRFGLANAADEIPSTFLDDNTGGSAVQMLNFLSYLGVDEKWLSETTAALDPVKPGMSRTEASASALLPNFAASIGLAGGLGGFAAALPSGKRARKAQAARTARQTARDQLEADGVIQTDDTGKSKLGDAIQQNEEELLATANEGAVEVDALAETLDGQASDADLDEVLARGEAESIPQVVEEVTQRAQPEAVTEGLTYDSVAAPVEALPELGDPSQRFTSVQTGELLSLAHPSNSPTLVKKITELTGKSWEEFTRNDILQGITALEADGLTVLPSRMMGMPTMQVGDIKVDPERFQFKMGTDAQGQQKGNSLTGVTKWNEDLEGSIQVWEDPMDGQTYVVNGHNRLAKAKELGIPNMRVEYINAPTAEAARSKGALTNIAQGGGTAVDAGKFFRDYGGGMPLNPADLENLGIPMRSGLATEGLALSRLPGNIFQDVVDGRISKAKALALGGSGLDETGMQAAYKALQARDLSDSAFNEVLLQAKNAPTVEGAQVDLFGNTDMLNLMVQKGELAARIRKALMADKNLMKRTAKNANRLTEVGNEIDKAATGTLADDTEALLAEFDATKYTEGPTSQLLNEGAEQINNGAKVKVVADRIRRQLFEAAENTPAPAKVAEEVVEEAPQLTRRQKVSKIAAMAAEKGEAKPPTTPLPMSPDPGDLDVSGDRADVALLKVLDNEARLKEEFAEIDDALAGDRLQAERTANGYDTMTFEEKKSNGLLKPLAGYKNEFDPLAEVINNPSERFTMPKGYEKSAPRFGMAKLTFQDDLDRAAYILQSKSSSEKAKKTKAAITKALEEQGFDVPDVRRLGAEIKDEIQNQIEAVTGSRRAPQEALEVEVPRSEAGGEFFASKQFPQASLASPDYDEAKFREKWADAMADDQRMKESVLLDIGMKLPSTAMRMAQLSEKLATEMLTGLKEAARISGLDPVRIQYLDSINTRELFGFEESIRSLEQWNPDAAKFVSDNPDDPLSAFVDGTTGGVYVPRQHESAHRGMIYLALGPNLDTRLTGRYFDRMGGKPMQMTAYHEAFHAVQEWLTTMSEADRAPALRALWDEKGLEEMTELIKKDKFGNYEPGMAPSEVQAEAFSVWYHNRKVRMKTTGLQKAFEQIKAFINTLRRKWKKALNKRPDWVDVFELAASGEIAEQGNLTVKKMRPEALDALQGRIDNKMDALLPDLTDRVMERLKQKQAEFDLLSERLADEIALEGC